jgi:hypothetical protein
MGIALPCRSPIPVFRNTTVFHSEHYDFELAPIFSVHCLMSQEHQRRGETPDEAGRTGAPVRFPRTPRSFPKRVIASISNLQSDSS